MKHHTRYDKKLGSVVFVTAEGMAPIENILLIQQVIFSNISLAGSLHYILLFRETDHEH
jgi:hypothetical protein